jgi:HEAT repeat protein
VVVITDETIDALVQALDSNDSRVRRNAGRLLLDHAEQAVPSLIGALTIPSRRMCWEAAKVLAQIDDARWFEPMVQVMISDNVLLGQVAVHALTRFGRQATYAYTAALTLSHPLVRPLIIETLGNLGDPRAISPLMVLLMNETNPTWRYLTIEALTCLKAHEALDLIETFAGDENHHVCERVELARQSLHRDEA